MSGGRSVSGVAPEGDGVNEVATRSCLSYITHLSHTFHSPASVRNYLSGVRFLHKSQGLPLPSLDSFHITSLLRAVSLTMRTPPLRRLPILPRLLHKLCSLCSSLGDLGLAMHVSLTLGFFGMLRQSNLAPPPHYSSILPGTPAGWTCCRPHLASSSSSGGQRPTSPLVCPQYYPYLHCQVIPPTPWRLFRPSSLLPPPPPQINPSLLTLGPTT